MAYFPSTKRSDTLTRHMIHLRSDTLTRHMIHLRSDTLSRYCFDFHYSLVKS